MTLVFTPFVVQPVSTDSLPFLYNGSIAARLRGQTLSNKPRSAARQEMMHVIDRLGAFMCDGNDGRGGRRRYRGR